MTPHTLTAFPGGAQLDLLDEACQLRDQALAAVNSGATGWDRSCVDAVIYDRMVHGRFSANECRDLIAAPSRHLLSARLNSFRMRGLIEIVDWVVSTDPGTHGKKIAIYRAVTA